LRPPEPVARFAISTGSAGAGAVEDARQLAEGTVIFLNIQRGLLA